MSKIVLSPLVRISFGLAMLTVSLLLISDFMGFIPNNNKAELKARESIAESLAVQLSTALTTKELHGVEETVNAVVTRNDSVLSAALRTIDGSIILESGFHTDFWSLNSTDPSSATEIQVAIFDHKGRWGNMELRFRPIGGLKETFSDRQSFFNLSIFLAIAGFFAYMIFLKKVVHELNTDDVIPDRVGKALDTLTEAILIVDDSDYIVFANQSFFILCGEPSDQVVGKRTRDFAWCTDDGKTELTELPWALTCSESKTLKGHYIELKCAHGKTLYLTVNATAIGGDEEKGQGALITFDNVTHIEAKNEELQKTLGRLQQTQKEVTEQNIQLQKLATRDPLTDSLNRRSLFQGLETLISETFWEDNNLCFIMIDIDHFKAVNDNYGHSTGDRVIVYLANCLREHARSNDLVARFGGEEFCIVLPNTQIEEAAAIAERIRHALETGHGGDYDEKLKITASFGVSTLSQTASDGETLLEQADQALYVAKNNGRNRVVCWKLAHAEPTPSGEQIDSSATAKQPETVEKIDDHEISLLNEELNIKLANGPSQSLSLPPQGGHGQLLLTDRIDQALYRSSRYNTFFAVVSLDVEILQRVNDTLGSAVGSKLLSAITARLKTIVRDTDSIVVQADDETHAFSISALGNREIVLLLTDLESIDGLNVVTKRIAQSHKDPLLIEGNEFIFNANMGISLYPQDGLHSSALLKNASIAKSEAMGKQGESNICFYRDEIEQESRLMIQLEAELLRAIERDELVMFFQPKVSLRTGEIIGLEALVRWQHPSRGLVPPDDFIPLAEKTGLIEELSKWVIRSVCQQIKRWQKNKATCVHVSINLSPVEFRNPHLADDIISTILEIGIEPSLLEVEITEAIAVHNMEAAVQMLEKIAAAGIGISVDDFGTGYASLSYLQRLPIHKIKIDRSFIDGVLENPNDAAIVSAVIAMGHTLGLEVIAEGVENLEQVQFLLDLQCDQIQGYFISRPIPSEQLGQLLQNGNPIKELISSSTNTQQRFAFSNTGPLLSTINPAPQSPQKVQIIR